MGAPPSHKYRKPSPLPARATKHDPNCSTYIGDLCDCQGITVEEASVRRHADGDDEIMVSGVRMTRRRARELGVVEC
jgi:hypothetical protein